jgi:FMN phosphatase YigB (HAD superfamily)
VGDNPWADVEGARHAGLRAVWMDRHGAPWPGDLEPPQETVHSLLDLLTLLR